MNARAILVAMVEARRFIKAAEAAKAKVEDDAMAAYGSVETAACRRASMDLTRQLAKMRRGDA